MSSTTTVKFKFPSSLLERVDAAAAESGMSRTIFFVDAVENELTRLEESKVKEEIALLEINQKILAEGHSVNVISDGEGHGPDSVHAECAMCHAELPPPPREVSGPLFCPDCMGIAKGAAFDGLTP